ncbi:hypothetical protein ACFQ3Z_20550 [Streptomyces nogalater]
MRTAHGRTEEPSTRRGIPGAPRWPPGCASPTRRPWTSSRRCGGWTPPSPGAVPRTAAQFGQDLVSLGYTVGPRLRTVRRLWCRDGEAVALVGGPRGSSHVAWESCLLVLLGCVPAPGRGRARTSPRPSGTYGSTGRSPRRRGYGPSSPPQLGPDGHGPCHGARLAGRPLAEFGGIELRRVAPVPSRGTLGAGGLLGTVRKSADRMVTAARMLREPRGVWRLCRARRPTASRGRRPRRGRPAGPAAAVRAPARRRRTGARRPVR